MALVESLGPLEYVTASRHTFAAVFTWRAPGRVLSLRSLRSLRPLSYTPSSVGLLSALQSLAGRKKVLFFSSARKLAPTAILYALLRRAGSALRGLGLLVAPLLLRPAPRCSCMVVVIAKPPYVIEIGTSHTPGRGKGVGCLMRSVVARRWASQAFFTPFGQCLRSPPPLLPPPLATSVSVKASGCPSGITPEAFT